MKSYARSICLAFLLISLITLPFVSCTNTQPPIAPIAQFSLGQSPVETNRPAQFNDQSSGEIATWAWDFGDNTTSSEQNPIHAYSKPGNYTVILTVSNKAGSNSASSTIKVIEPLIAKFSASKTRVLIGENIKFTDESIGDVKSRLWDFGDNTTLKTRNPDHSYDAPGAYTVSLKVSNADTSDIAIKKDLVLISPLSVKVVFSSSFTETGEYIPDEDEIFQPGEDIWVIFEFTGFDQRETEAGYEVWLKVQQLNVNGVITAEEDVIERHEINALPVEVAFIAICIGRYDVDNELGLGLGYVRATFEDVIGSFTVTGSRAFLIKE